MCGRAARRVKLIWGAYRGAAHAILRLALSEGCEIGDFDWSGLGQRPAVWNLSNQHIDFIAVFPLQRLRAAFYGLCAEHRERPMPFLSSALQSGAVLLREGIEALLVIAALATFLQRAQAMRAIRALYVGAGAAIVASLAAAYLFDRFMNGAHDDRLEAVVMLVAAGLMFYMSGWLFLKQDGRAWIDALKRDADAALDARTMLPIAGIAFLAVFREGAETVLFLHALALSEGGWNAGLATGLAGAALLLALLFHAMRMMAMRLPLKPLFLATSGFLFVMGLRFVGGAIQELQEQALVPVHFANDLVDLLTPLGLNATWEAIGAQGAIAAAAAASIVILWLARQQRHA